MTLRVVDILDDQRQVVAAEPIEAAHTKGLLHRSIHVLVVDGGSQVFVRQRPANKPIYPGLWTSSVGTHVLTGDTDEKTAVAGLRYFLGLEDPLENIGERRVHDAFENEIITVFRCRADAVPNLNAAEGADGRFMSLAKIRELAASGRTTPHLMAALECLI